MTRIAVIIGSTRPGRNGLQVAKWVMDHTQTRTGADYALIDLADPALPLLDEPVPPSLGQYQKPHTKKWAETVAAFDGYVFVTPEYNHSTSGVLKNAIDYLYAEWNNKAVGFVSYGGMSGVRAVEHLRLIAGELQMADVRQQVALSLMTDFENFSEFTPGRAAGRRVARHARPVDLVGERARAAACRVSGESTDRHLMGGEGVWPDVDHARVGGTVEHLHRLTQVAGKYTLGDLFEPGWGNIVLDVTPRGLRTPVMHQEGDSFEVHYRLLDGDVVIESENGARTVQLSEGTVAGFYHEFVNVIRGLGLPEPRSSLACEIPGAQSLDTDSVFRPWEDDAARSIWSALSTASGALKTWQAPFRGYRPRVGVMWGAFDLSSTRYRGRYVDPPADRPPFLQHGMTEEYVSVGFAFGTDDAPDAGFYAYIAPQPGGIDRWSDWGVEGAHWNAAEGLAVLPWNRLTDAADPAAAVVLFGDAVYRAAVELADWPPELVMPRFDGWHASTTPPDARHRVAGGTIAR